jgi:hypothetical protein
MGGRPPNPRCGGPPPPTPPAGRLAGGWVELRAVWRRCCLCGDAAVLSSDPVPCLQGRSVFRKQRQEQHARREGVERRHLRRVGGGRAGTAARIIRPSRLGWRLPIRLNDGQIPDRLRQGRRTPGARTPYGSWSPSRARSSSSSPASRASRCHLRTAESRLMVRLGAALADSGPTAL